MYLRFLEYTRYQSREKEILKWQLECLEIVYTMYTLWRLARVLKYCRWQARTSRKKYHEVRSRRSFFVPPFDDISTSACTVVIIPPLPYIYPKSDTLHQQWSQRLRDKRKGPWSRGSVLCCTLLVRNPKSLFHYRYHHRRRRHHSHWVPFPGFIYRFLCFVFSWCCCTLLFVTRT